MIPGWGTKISHAVQLGQKKNIYIYTHTHTHIYIYTRTHFKKPNFVIRQRVIII